MTEGPYRQPAPVPQDPYMVDWATLRRRRLHRRAWFVVLLTLLMGAVFMAIEGGSSRPHARPFIDTNELMEALGAVLGFGFLGAVFFGARHFLPFVCPGCRQPFFDGPAAEIGLADECVECGLAVGTPEAKGKSGRSADLG